MAKLKLPDACPACGEALAEGDRIVFERTAKLEPGYKVGWEYQPDPLRPERLFPQRVVTHPLQPMVVPTSPCNVRHVDCSNPQA